MMVSAGLAQAQIEEVVVTAQKREQNAQDVGIAVTAFGESEVRAMRLTSADDIADSVSGVQIYNYRGKSQPSFVIRGIGTQDFAPNSAPTAAVYIDEVYLGSNIVTGFQIFDVERVEVLKGPQGTLFGRNTTGGAISYTSKRPSDALEGYAEVGFGNYQTTETSVAVGGAVTERVRMRLSAKASEQDEGYYKNTFTPDQNPFGPSPNFSNMKSSIGEDSHWAARLLTEVDIGDNGSLLLNLHGGRRDADTLPVTPIGFTTIPGSGGTCEATATGGEVSDPRFCGDAFGYSDTDGDEYTVSNDYVGENEESNLGISARVEWDFGEIALTSITAWESADKEQTADADGSPFFVFNNVTDVEFEQLSQELRLTSNTGDDLFWILGLYYAHDEIDQGFCGDLNLALGLGAECRNDFSQVTDNGALYGQAEYPISEKLRLTLGLRYTYEKRDFNSVNTFTDEFGNEAPANFGSGPEDDAIIDDSVSTSDLSGRLGLDYFFTEDVLFYASVSRGFKSGGYDGDFSFTRQQLEPYDEETITAYELGWKTTLADSRVRFNGAAFHYDYSGPQTRVQRVSSAGLPFNQLINLDSASVYGLEADLAWVPTDRLHFAVSATLLDTDLSEGRTDPALALFDGNDLPLAATESFTILGRYEYPVTERHSAVIQLDGKYNGDYELNAENLGWLAQDSYFLANARISILRNDGQWELTAWGKNLSDETFSVGSYSLFGAFPAFYNSPRTYGVTFRYDW
ncbi:TonB-dependent receptor [Kineobactrum salinum]|uniref:TonB-dependent receptor n=1 Tax=Kineobactrum salinum TaxID=2708301 RepID=A0A6C0U015_9GAMM|nr:TonB-dependent receptor [Kineobactrum salinum]QIB65113.1 TonB-dependent receptor [Kineobactrum salinum]